MNYGNKNVDIKFSEYDTKDLEISVINQDAFLSNLNDISDDMFNPFVLPCL